MTSPRAPSDDAENARDAGFRCCVCGDVIGVYEPLVIGCDAGVRATSRAAEPDLGAMGTYCHAVCVAALADQPSSAGG